MVGTSEISPFIRKWKMLLSMMILLILCPLSAGAQEMPPRPVAVYLDQNLSFGAFSTGVSGGTVIMYTDGTRTATGSVMLVNMGFLYYPAIFSVETNPGNIVSILYGGDVILTGNNGGSMTVQLRDPEPPSPFVTTAIPPSRTLIYIGATLVVGNPLANPPGSYNGTFSIFFNQE
jgi:hypothetical protein